MFFFLISKSDRSIGKRARDRELPIGEEKQQQRQHYLELLETRARMELELQLEMFKQERCSYQ